MRQRIAVVVGSRVELNISAAWGNEEYMGLWYGNEPYGNYNLSLYAYEDPGVPNGAILTTQSCLGYPQQRWYAVLLVPSIMPTMHAAAC